MSGGHSQRTATRRLPSGIWALGFVSLLMDTSSEMIHSLLPVFLVAVLGASTMTVGLVEGIGESTAAISKLFSGWLSDRLGRRKALTVAGYAVAALSKPLFATAPTPLWVLVARFSDRLGKGIRGAPRDALIGDLAPPELRGAAYGLRQSLDTVGAIIGPLFALVLMAAFAGDFRLVFWVAVVPAAAAVAILVRAVPEPPAIHAGQTAHARIAWWRDLRALGRAYWAVVFVGAVLTLARFSEAFLILRAEHAGLPIALAPIVLVLMNIVYAASAYPAGLLADRFDRWSLLAAGFAVLIAADLALALAPALWVVLLGAGLWGLHMGLTQGLLAVLVVDAAPALLRGTAFGLFHLASGVALLLANLVAALLWEGVGPQATFIAGALFTAAGLAGLARLRSRQ